MNSILIVAHSPLASALRQGVLHVFPDNAQWVAAVDILPDTPLEESLATARSVLAQLIAAPRGPGVLLVTDVFGATPCNVAQKLVAGRETRLVTGANLPMLLRAMTYRHEPLDTLVMRAMAGATQGVMQVSVTAPQNQPKRQHDPNHDDHQQ